MDCCPASFFEPLQGGKLVSKWRPLQCFIALTDTNEPEQGGFEAAKGFHNKFEAWAAESSIREGGTGHAACVGEFTPIRPREDSDILASFAHVPCCAGDLVVWDNKIPHANSRANNLDRAREVVYLGYLPDVPLNREYASKQLKRFARGDPPDDQWIHRKDDEGGGPASKRLPEYEFSQLGRRLMGADSWDGD